MNLINFCKTYFSVTNIPVSLIKNDEAVYSTIGVIIALSNQRSIGKWHQ